MGAFCRESTRFKRKLRILLSQCVVDHFIAHVRIPSICVNAWHCLHDCVTLWRTLNLRDCWILIGQNVSHGTWRFFKFEVWPNEFIVGFVTYCVGCCMVCRYNWFISRELVYILRCFHSHSFASYECLYALKIKYPMREGCRFTHIHIYNEHNSQYVYCIVSRLHVVFWAFQSFCNFTVSFSYTSYKSMHKGQWVYCIISCLLVIFWAFQSVCNFARKT